MKLYRTPWIYDCTNFYFEIEQADEFRKYGKSNEHRPNPLVQMCLFMDGDGIPIAFDLFDGASNEQPSLKPLEKKLIRDFGFEQLIVCTDAGLGSEANRRFNDVNGRVFVVTQSLKKLKDDILTVSEGRWKIEESFRILKTDFESRPVYISREDRIRAHFLTCYWHSLSFGYWKRNSEMAIHQVRSFKH